MENTDQIFSPAFFDSFEKDGLYEFRHFLSQEEAQAVLQELLETEKMGLFKKAGIGREEQFHIDQTQRGDFIHWNDPETCLPATRAFYERIHVLVQALNRTFYLGIRTYESHYTRYPAGTFYKKHRDRHKSLSHRIVSFVLYLNPEWKESDGGILRVYMEDGSHRDIEPRFGSLAVFLSEKEHEVFLTNRERSSITGWMLNIDPM